MVDKETKKVNPIVVGLGIVIIILIVFFILAILGVFTSKPKPQRLPHGRDLYTEKELGLYDTTAKCRVKYPNNPLAFGNDKMKFNKGCYECPEGYFIRDYKTLDYEDTPRCYKTEFKPAGGEENILSCAKHVGKNSSPDTWLYALKPESRLTPWEAIQPYACKIRKDTQNPVPANFLGAI